MSSSFPSVCKEREGGGERERERERECVCVCASRARTIDNQVSHRSIDRKNLEGSNIANVLDRLAEISRSNELL